MADLMVTGEGLGRQGAAGLPPDEPIDVGRYVSALRRSWPLILLIIAALTSAVYLVSLTLEEKYRATAKIVVERTGDPLDSGDVLSLERRLATIQALLTTRETLRRAARRLPGERAATLDDKVQASVDPNANIINVVATDDTARGAAAIANAVATTFLADDRRAERRRLNRARATLLRALADLEGRRGIPAAEERASIRERLTDLNVGVASTSTELDLAEAARPPADPYSPQPARNAIFAFFASAFLAGLLVLARAQLKPRVTGTRELSRLLDLPVMVEIPYVRRRFGVAPRTLKPVEYEAYQTLQASLRMQLPPTRQQVVLVTSAFHGEGKTEVTAALGLVLSHAGLRTWLVSADMRRPRLHELFDVAQTPGLAEVLAEARRSGSSLASEMSAGRTGGRGESGSLHVLASGRMPADPAQLLASDALDAFFDEIKQSEYDYVLLDGPPLFGLVDSQVLAQRVDGVLIVCRSDRMTQEQAIRLRELLQRLHVPALGFVTIGARGSHVSYLEG
ncbi:MAG TPA: P-loop NTPase [Gaiellaceae bacterium]|jgi:capsular exopolysaccharide synthesis family protein|nr:P-loop NTPase [Gaiellaceae bacterium]